MTKKKALAARAQGGIALKAARRGKKEDRRARKVVIRRKQKHSIAADAWAAPAPSHLVAKLDVPKVKSKYQSYFEFAENTERKEKRLEFQITDDPKPPPGFAFVPIGDPVLTKACKELSRERDAMIFIVSASKEEKSKISEHMYRSGYHFRESIVEHARQVIGETFHTHSAIVPGQIEPIPETQEEITKQADGAIRDLFPRIPNTDRQMILEHAFKKGAQFHGEPTVGLQADLPLSRRVQLAVLAHIRHTHTRYDKLLRETTWVNARKVVEPVCLDVLVKWRGDEETGRDQMDEILREVVIITDSEEENGSFSEEDSSSDEGEVTSVSSAEASPALASRSQQRAVQLQTSTEEVILDQPAIESTTNSASLVSLPAQAKINSITRQERRAQRGSKRYQTAWENALHRRQNPSRQSDTPHLHTLCEGAVNERSPRRDVPRHPLPGANVAFRDIEFSNRDQRHYGIHLVTRPDPYNPQHRPTAEAQIQRNGAIVRSPSERNINLDPSRPSGIASQPIWEQNPSQVVRGSPQRHGLQDMLVPSIETSSSDVMRPLDERHNVYDEPQELYSRRVIENRRPSPPRRQVIVIDDVSPPQIKRRRLVEDSGDSRAFASSGYDDYAAAAPSDFHLLQSSSIQPKDFLVRPPAVKSKSSQGSPWNARSSYVASTGQIPIYDAPEPGSLARPPEQYRRADVLNASQHGGPNFVRQINPAPFHHSLSDAVYLPATKTAMAVESVRYRESDHHSNHTRRLRPPQFAASRRVSRSYDEGPNRPIIDKTFIHDFSQSRLDSPVQTTDGCHVFATQSHQESEVQGNRPHDYEDHFARSFSTLLPARARSPAGSIQRPISMYGYGETGQPVVYDEHSRMRTLHHTPVEQPPILVREGVMRSHTSLASHRTRPPRHELVMLE